MNYLGATTDLQYLSSVVIWTTLFSFQKHVRPITLMGLIMGAGFDANWQLDGEPILSHFASIEAKKLANRLLITPIMYCARSDLLVTAMVLVAAGADVCTRAHSGHSALDMAREYGQWGVEMLLEEVILKFES